MNESGLVFDCQGHRLIGVLTTPKTSARVGVLIIVGGPQYRVGSHRQFVQLAHAVAGVGMAAMRFDARGMGDSEGPATTYEDIGPDLAAAIDAFKASIPSLERIVLWGLCGGATAALLYLRSTSDPRVVGLVLVNPWVRSEVTLARATVKYYYAQRLLQREFWLKLLSGKVASQAAAELLRHLRAAIMPQQVRGALASGVEGPLQERMIESWSAFGGASLVLLSGNDYTAKEFIEASRADRRWLSLLQRPSVRRVDVEGADHTFSAPAAHSALTCSTLDWLQQLRQSG